MEKILNEWKCLIIIIKKIVLKNNDLGNSFDEEHQDVFKN